MTDSEALKFIPDKAAWAVCMRRYSPGDFFRLLHGCDCAFRDKVPVVFLADDCLYASGKDLRDGNNPQQLYESEKVSITSSEWHDLTVYWLILHELQNIDAGGDIGIADFVSTWNNAFNSEGIGFCRGSQQLWTMYSPDGRKSKQKNYGDEYSLEYEGILLRRIDTEKAAPQTLKITDWQFFERAFEIQLPDRQTERKVAVVLREDGLIATWRNSPEYHKCRKLFDKLEKDHDVEFWWMGLGTEGAYPSSLRDRCIPYAGKSFRDQIVDAKKYCLAVGVNSSGLDIFSLAGIPILRECEFQAQAKKGWPGKERFNRFLGIAPNIGLGITRKQYESGKVNKQTWWDRNRFLDSLQKMLQAHEKLKPTNDLANPKHYVVSSEEYTVDKVIQQFSS